MPGRATAVDDVRGAGDEAGGRRGEEHHEPLQLLRIVHAPERDQRRPRLLHLLRRVLGDAAADERSVERAGADRIHEDAVQRKLECGLADHVDHGGLAREVAVTDERLGAKPGVGCHDDDAARPLALHDRRCASHGEHDAAQVDAEHLVPVRSLHRVECLAAVNAEAGHRGDAGVREHHVDTTVLPDRVVEKRLHARLVRHVDDERAGTSSRARRASAWIARAAPRRCPQA